MQALRTFFVTRNHLSRKLMPIIQPNNIITRSYSHKDTTKVNSNTEALNELDTIKKELATKELHLKELKDSYLLTLADMENLRQRTKREVESASQFAIQKFCKDIISVADVLEIALTTKKSNSTEDVDYAANQQLQDMLEGLSMTLGELHKIFAKYGITPIEPLHQKFDPNLHNALYELPNAEVEPGTIVSVQKKGYLLHQRVIRPADVGVARKP